MAAHFRVCPRTITKWMVGGIITAYLKVGRVLRFDVHSCEVELKEKLVKEDGL